MRKRSLNGGNKVEEVGSPVTPLFSDLLEKHLGDL
jgi:hypothetical protein